MSTLSEACLYDWDVERMLVWLREESLHDCVMPFSLKKINGISFLNLSDGDIRSLRISQESKRKLTKVLKKIKAKKRNVTKRFEGETSRIEELKKPSSVPAHVHDDPHEDAESDGWCTDEFSDDPDEEDEEEQSDDDSGGDYIEPEEDDRLNHTPGSPSKEVANVPLGLVAQLKAGLNGTIRKNPFMGPPTSPHTKTAPSPFEDEEDQIYDEPPDGEEDEVYEQPSDDSGGGIVVRPMSHRKIIRCESDKGEYLDARAPKYIDQDNAGPPPPPGRPPKPGSLKAKKTSPPPVSMDQEIYDEVPEDDETGRTQIVEPEQETYEVPDDGGLDTGNSQHDQSISETYEVPDQPDEQETYEVPEEPAPARPPPRKPGGGLGLKPPIRQAEKAKTPLPKELPKPKPVAKPAINPKPQIRPKPNTAAPAQSILTKPSPAGSSGQTSRLYPAPKDTNAVSPERPSSKRLPGFPSPGSRTAVIPPPSQDSERNNNEIPKSTSSPRIQPLSRRPIPPPVDDTPPPPPRPGIKPPPHKPPRLSDSDNQDDHFTPPGRQLPATKMNKSPLPAPPEPKPVDPLKQSPWFQGPLDKKIAESALRSFSKEGAFIVRNSSKDQNNYSMSLLFQGNVKHLRMPQVNRRFVLGDSGKVQFSSVIELVDYYSQHPVELKSGGSTCLTAACPVRL